jgi:poly(3-hydroxybutyrate) depolymerase
MLLFVSLFNQKPFKRFSCLFLLVCILSFSFNEEANCQTSAPPGIFADTVYHSIKVTSDIVYGSNFNPFFNQVDTLKLDTYEPDSVIDYLRPVLIYAHGGGFTAGDKTTDKAEIFGNHFAMLGYLYASINYRLYSDDLYDTIDNFREVYMCTQDAKSAVRFFRKHASEYCVDTSKIFMTGTSAGGAICLNAAYWDQAEADSIFNSDDLGPLDNGSGNEGYSSALSAIVSCWGGIPDTAWLENETTPNQLFHGTQDPVVPYVWGLSANGVYLFGSYTIHEASLANNIESYLHPFPGAGHGVSSNSPQFDTLLQVSTVFLYNHLNPGEGSVACTLPLSVNQPFSQDDLITITSIDESDFLIQNNQILPFHGQIKIYSMQGNLLNAYAVDISSYNSLTLHSGHLSCGCYLVEMRSMQYLHTGKIMVTN